MSTSTPGLTSWSAIRITFPVIVLGQGRRRLLRQNWELERFGDGESVQTSATARSGVVSVVVSVRFGYPAGHAVSRLSC